MKYTPTEEQETTINMEAVSKTAEIYTCEPNMIRKLEKLAEAHPDEVVLERPDDYGIIVRLPRKYIKVQPPKKCNFSEETLKAMGERLRQAKAARSE